MSKNSERIIFFLLGCGFSGILFYFFQTQGKIEPIKMVTAPISTSPATTTKQPAAVPKSLGQPDYQIARKLLANKQYSEFMQNYASIYSVAEELEAAKYRQLVIDALNSLLKGKQYGTAQILLSLYLGYEYNDIEALGLLAKLHREQHNYLAAIDALFKAKSYAYDTEVINELTRITRSVVTQYSKELAQKSDYLSLLELYRRLTDLQPDYAPYFIGLAETYIALDNYEDARRALSLAANNPDMSAQIQKLMDKINNKPVLDLDNTAAVALQRSGDQFLVEALLNNSITVTLLLDTGASLSIITPTTLANLGLSTDQAQKIGWFSTANGVVQAPIMALDSLSLNGQTANNIAVGVMEISPTNDIEGLLGMNFLTHFKFYIDQNDNLLHLQLR